MSGKFFSLQSTNIELVVNNTYELDEIETNLINQY